MYTSILLAAGLLGLAQAQSYTPPGANTFGALYTPNTQQPVTEGSVFKVTWDPTGHTSSTISLVLCHGPSTNCVNQPNAIVSGIPASQAYYNWNVPCSLAPGVAQTATGYGMLIIADDSGDFQYSTQFSVLAGNSCGNTGSSSSTSSSSTSSITTTNKSSSASGSVTSSSWGTWMTLTTAPNNYTMTSVKPTNPTSLKASTTSVAVAVTTAYASTSVVASPSPSLFHGAATQIGGSAAGLILAAGAALFAL